LSLCSSNYSLIAYNDSIFKFDYYPTEWTKKKPKFKFSIDYTIHFYPIKI